jgi:hypothetical protein
MWTRSHIKIKYRKARFSKEGEVILDDREKLVWTKLKDGSIRCEDYPPLQVTRSHIKMDLDSHYHLI